MICSFGVRRRTILRLHGEQSGQAIEPGVTPRAAPEGSEAAQAEGAEASWVDARRACPNAQPYRSSGVVWRWTWGGNQGHNLDSL